MKAETDYKYDRYRAVRILRAARAFYPLTELSKIIGIPVPMLSRYISGSSLPSEGNARKIVDSLLSRGFVTSLVAKAIRVYNGFYNISGVTLDPMALTLVSEYAINRFDRSFNLVLTPEAGGISLATAIGLAANVPIVVARKQRPPSEEPVLESMHLSGPASYTVFYVTKREIPKDSKVLIVDDFSVHGHTLKALAELVRKAGAKLVGTMVVVGIGVDWKIIDNSEALLEIRG
mgnify:CR=1 FL=1